MKALQSTVLGLAVAMSGPMCQAQDTSIPFREIQPDAQMFATSAVPAREAAIGRGLGTLSTPSPSAGSVSLPPAARAPRTLSSGYFLMQGFHLGLAVLDVELTQRCIANHHCVEGNPLMPSSHAGQLGINFALVGYGAFVSYKLKKQDRKLWLLSPTVGIAAHSVGVATGIAHR